MEYKSKYKMTVEQNIFTAKRNIVDYIWKSARLEGINVTFPQTYAIIEKTRVNGVDVEDILKITNLKHAWQYVFETINKQPLDLDFLCKLHSEVARGEALEWGKLRSGKVYVSGTSYIPPIPNVDKVNNALNGLLSIENPTERSIEVMLWGMKSQLFWDGNKRNSMLAANKIMIENGCGIISVPNEHLEQFNEVLCDYYTNDTLEQVKQFVYEYCIDGLDFGEEMQSDEDDEDYDFEP